jgi:subtilisin family serine protease
MKPMTVVDMAENAEAHVDLFKSKGVRAVARRYATTPESRLTRIETAALSAAGFEIVAVFEERGDPELSVEQGIHDAQVALQQARNVRQPAGSAIYFAFRRKSYSLADVDAIGSYFDGVREVLSGAYKVGVVSSGAVCDALMKDGVCDYAWRSDPGGQTDAEWAIAWHGSDNWDGVAADVSDARDDFGAFAVPAQAKPVAPFAAGAGLDVHASTPDGYTPPAASLGLLTGVPFDRAVRVGTKFTDAFLAWDQSPRGRADPSRCKGLYRLPGNVLFWESKMAIDADGSPTPSVLRSSSGSDQNTSLLFAQRPHPVNSEVVPYFVLPRGDFVRELGIELGSLGVVIFGDQITGAIFADAGPESKIGEASIRVHELVRGPAAPWKGDPANKIIRDVSVEKGVLYVVFPNARFDIDTFGPARQADMAMAIHAAAMAEFERLKAAPAPAPQVAMAHPAPARPAVTARTPTDFFAYASNWQALLNALDGEPDAPIDDGADQRPFALAAIPKLRARTAGRLLVGFDAGDVAHDKLADAVDLAVSARASLAVFVEGPGAPSGRTWRKDEKRRLCSNAETVLPGVDVQRMDFKALLDLWDNRAWWTFTRNQLADFKKKGFSACHIGNLGRVFGRFPASFGRGPAGGTNAETATLGFLHEYAEAHAGGELPDLITRNLDVGVLERIKAAVVDGSLPRAMFADFHIAEDDSTDDPAAQEQLTADIGIQTLRCADPDYVMGSFGALARSRFAAALGQSAIPAAPAPDATALQGVAAADRQHLKALSPRASISLQLMSKAAAAARPAPNPSLVTTMARAARPATPAAEPLMPVLVEIDDGMEDLIRSAGIRDFEQLTPTIASVSVPLSRAAVLIGDARVRFVESVKEKQPLLERALPDALVLLGVGQTRAVPETGKGVVVGVVDSGFDLSHPAFSSGGALRVDALWDQTTGEKIVGWQNVKDRWDQGTGFAVDQLGHGTHVASIAGGSAFSGISGVAPDARFVLVKTDFQQIASGVKWCFDTSNGKPCVVNLSLGGHFGAHDGQGIEERVLSTLAGAGRIIVAAAGNEREDNIHIGARFAPSQTETVVFDVEQNAQPQAVMTLWYDVSDDFDIVLVSPSGIEIAVPAVGMSDGRVTDGATIEVARNVSNPATSVQTQITLTFSPQAVFNGSLSGWGLRMTCRLANVGRLDGWMAGEQLAKFRAGSGRMIEATRTIGMPATANNVIAVASHVTKNTWTSGRGTEIARIAVVGRSSRFSSQGPTRDGREKPEISAPGEMITAALADGSQEAQREDRVNVAAQTLALEGTSMATPMVTGAIAALLERNRALTPAEALQALRDGARKDIFTGGLSWTPEYGYGKLSLRGAMDALSAPPQAVAQALPKRGRR